VPAADAARRAWLGERIRQRIRPLADRYRDQLLRSYGEGGRQVEFVEAFEVSEYGSPLDAAARSRLFLFLPPLESGGSRPAQEWVDIRDDE
jgi:N-acetylglucosamine malate deacetylase 1